MTETVASDRPSFAKPVSRSRSRKPNCSRAYIGKLEADGIIQRQGDGFPLDQNRVAYLRYLRRERQQVPRSEADADHVRAKAELLRLRITEKKKVLMLASEHEAFVETLTGLFLTGLSGFAARCGGRDLAVRRAIDQAVYDLRLEISKTQAGWRTSTASLRI